MFALESAMDELALAAGIDPVELRIRNDPQAEPDSGLPFSSRNLVACLREGARRFGWTGRDPRPRMRRDGRYLIGTGVAASTYPARRRPSTANVRVTGDGFEVRIAASDIGAGARTALAEIAARPCPSGPIRSGSNSATALSLRRRWRAARWALPHGARPSSRPARTC